MARENFNDQHYNAQPVQYTHNDPTLVEVVDRILDKGIVIDAWINISVIGIQLITIEARVIVASLETYVKYADIIAQTGPIAVGNRRGEKGIDQLTESIGKIPQNVKADRIGEGIKATAKKTKEKLQEADIL